MEVDLNETHSENACREQGAASLPTQQPLYEPSSYLHPCVQSVMACEPEPSSRTYQYRKTMKPMMERKRRARINKCLDELKDLMLTALHVEGESVAKLEKADVLELTVTHLKKLQHRNQLPVRPMPSTSIWNTSFPYCNSPASSLFNSSGNDTSSRPLATTTRASPNNRGLPTIAASPCPMWRPW